MTFAELIDKVTIPKIYDEIKKTERISYSAIVQWKRRNSIPPRYWKAVLKAARRQSKLVGMNLKYDDFVEMAEKSNIKQN